MPSRRPDLAAPLPPPIEHAALLCSMRLWVLGLRRAIGAPARIARVLSQVDAADAQGGLDTFMDAFRGGTTRPVGIACVCHPRPSDDERTLLDVFGLAQERRPFEALLLLRGMLTADAARQALSGAGQVGTVLARAGRFLPAPQTEVRRFVLTAGQDAPLAMDGAV